MKEREALRMAALRSYRILDTAPEQVFDRLTELAAELFDAPMAAMSLIDEDRQWFKARHGIEDQSTPRDWAFCAHAIEQEPRSVMVVENALEDARFRDNPLVTGEPDIRFYAGAVITGSEGQNLGALCVIDRQPRTVTPRELERLKTLAGLVANELELRCATQRIVDFQLATERALERLVEQANRARLAESLAGLGHYRLDLRNHQLSWSDQMYRIHGMEPGSPLEIPALKRLVHPDDRATVDAWMAQLKTTGQAPQIELRITRADGAEAFLLANGAAETDGAGAPRAVLGTVWDVTDLKRQALDADEARKEAQAARHEAEEAAAVKADFLANMSHELRTPLTSILGFMNLAAQQPELSDLTRTYLSRGRDAGQALLCTVNDVLDFSKLEAGQVRFDPRPTSLSAIGRSTLELFLPQAGAKDLFLTFEAEGPDQAMIDPDRMRQVLMNLVGNAIKFTEAGGVTLRVRYDGEAKRLEASVIDTGPGIPAAKIDNLFKRFSQVDGRLANANANANASGTGLGLSICKGLIEAQGGEVGVESAEGQGSRFWFTLPAAPAGSAKAAAGRSASGVKILAGLRILVADDHPVNRELARLFLEGVGAEVTDAVDGEHAVQQAAEWPFDLILMDLHMPRLDGAGALARIRAGGLNDATPVLAFTAAADSETDRRLLERGFDEVVTKPLEPQTLFAAVARATDFLMASPLARAS